MQILKRICHSIALKSEKEAVDFGKMLQIRCQSDVNVVNEEL